VLQGLDWAVSAAVSAMPRFTDLLYRDTPGGPVLYAAGRYGGGAVTVWDIDRATPVQTGSASWGRADAPGASPSLTLLETPGGLALLAGGGVGGALRLYATAADGSIGTSASLGQFGASFPGDLTQTVTVSLGDGRQAVFGGISGADGIGRVVLTEAGTLAEARWTRDNAATHADRVADLAAAVVGGQRYLFSLGGADPGVTAWTVSAAGSLAVADSLSVAEGLWIAAPTALAVADAGGQTFLIVAAAGSGSLSVIAVAPDGRLTPVDHVLDSLATRFGGATALATVSYGGQSYVVAGGADDGISLFQLLPDGRLLGRAHIADTTTAGLANISALAARATATGIEITAASASEAGLTRLTFAIDAGGVVRQAPATGGTGTGTVMGTGWDDLIVGGAGSDRLNGVGGEDVLMDGAGSDTLTGGAGADIFVLAADGASDTITDFTPGQDRLDLSAWALLRNPAQLTMAATASGLTIAYGDEMLIVQRAGGGTIAPGSLRLADLIDADRLAPGQYATDTGLPAGGELTGTPQADRLAAGHGGQRVTGMAGDDVLTGNGGNDILIGGAGRDVLDGGAGRNTLEGGLGNDRYVIRSRLDLIQGEVGFSLGGGIDTVESWVSFTLTPNLEVLRLMGLADLDGSGNAAPEVLVGNPGRNRLLGGGGDDRIVAKAGDDWIMGGGGRDELVGDAGADVFVYVSASDSRPGQASRDFINGFTRGQDAIDLSLIDANPRMVGDQAFRYLGSAAFTGRPGEVNFAHYGGNWVIVSADIDGDRAADMQIFVNLVTGLGRTDFIL